MISRDALKLSEKEITKLLDFLSGQCTVDDFDLLMALVAIVDNEFDEVMRNTERLLHPESVGVYHDNI